MFFNESFSNLPTSTRASHMPDKSAIYFNGGKRETATSSLRGDAMRKASSIKFAVIEEHADQPPQNPMRQLSHSFLPCLTERAESVRSLMASTRFTESDRSLVFEGDQLMDLPIRQLSKRSLLMASTRLTESDRSLLCEGDHLMDLPVRQLSKRSLMMGSTSFSGSDRSLPYRIVSPLQQACPLK
ncbi:unnamed protein product [Cylindrotheca closterium]|uniref:Uncharacterized protein n=1 Tax=Cylindrotheca closterium TaxID=2856 RepID=A0AAD2GAW2_9STRA|nr:unnamed protein product [Cylindrotheca closterium]